jgi:hypothetical protein
LHSRLGHNKVEETVIPCAGSPTSPSKVSQIKFSGTEREATENFGMRIQFKNVKIEATIAKFVPKSIFVFQDRKFNLRH